MKQYPASFLKYISILHRNTSRYFCIALEPCGIGSGQQFFLRHIYENQGVSMYDLAQMGQFDKATVTKAAQKLADMGYITIIQDITDRRIKRLYTTKKAQAVLEELYYKRNLWKDALMKDFSPDIEKQLEELLKKMADISCKEIDAIVKSREENYECNTN